LSLIAPFFSARDLNLSKAFSSSSSLKLNPKSSSLLIKACLPECFLSKSETGLDRDSIAMAHQIRVISKERLGRECGFISSQDLREKIKIALKKYLDI